MLKLLRPPWPREKTNYGLLCLLLAATILRFYQLNYQSFWQDELWTAIRVGQAPLSGLWSAIGEGGRKQYFYYVLCSVVSQVFGNDPLVYRALSAAFGVASIFAIHVLGKTLINERVGVVAATLATFSAFLIIYSQEGRSYSLLYFFLICLALFAIRAANAIREGRPQLRRDFAGLWFSFLLSAYLHHFALLAGVSIVAGAALPLLKNPATRQRSLVTFLSLGLGLIPLVPLLLESAAPKAWPNFPIPELSLQKIPEHFGAYLGSKWLQRIILAALAVALGVELKTRYVRSTVARNPKIWVPLFWLVIPMAVPLAAAQWIRDVSWAARYLSVVAPALLILVAVPLAAMLPFAGLGLTIFCVSYGGLASYDIVVRSQYYRRPFKDQFREATRAAVELVQVNKGARIAVVDSSAPLWAQMLKLTKGNVKVAWWSLHAEPKLAPFLVEAGDKVVAVAYGNVLPSPRLLQTFEIVEQQKFLRTAVYLLARRPSAEKASP